MNFDEFKNIFIESAVNLNIELEDTQVIQFYDYMRLLLKWNEKINLTAITEPKEIIMKHFIDSLTISKYIKDNTRIVDVGTGAGFPGIPLKIYRQNINVVLVDSLNKRVNFLNNVIKELNLNNIITVHSRIEDFGKDKNYREKFDYATARAVSNTSTLSEYLIPLVKIDGKCIYMKGSNVEDELTAGKKAIELLGGKIEKIEKLNLPSTDINRNIIIVKKVKNTSSKYPRKAGIPAKEPLE